MGWLPVTWPLGVDVEGRMEVALWLCFGCHTAAAAAAQRLQLLLLLLLLLPLVGVWYMPAAAGLGGAPCGCSWRRVNTVHGGKYEEVA